MINDAGENLGISAGDDEGDGASLPSWAVALIVVGVLLLLLVLTCIGTARGLFRDICPGFTAWMQGSAEVVSAKNAALDVESARSNAAEVSPNATPQLDKNEPTEVSTAMSSWPLPNPHLKPRLKPRLNPSSHEA